MVLKEFYVSLIIVSQFIKKNNLVQRLTTFSSSLDGRSGQLSESDLKEKIEPSINTMQNMLMTFEAETGFPLDGSVFLEKIGLSDVLSISAWEQLREDFRAGDFRTAIIELM